MEGEVEDDLDGPNDETIQHELENTSRGCACYCIRPGNHYIKFNLLVRSVLGTIHTYYVRPSVCMSR